MLRLQMIRCRVTPLRYHGPEVILRKVRHFCFNGLDVFLGAGYFPSQLINQTLHCVPLVRQARVIIRDPFEFGFIFGEGIFSGLYLFLKAKS